MKKYFFAFAVCFLGFANHGLSQVSFLDTIYFSNTDKYLWNFYQNLQTFVSVNDNLFVKEEQTGLKYVNTIDTLSSDVIGILEINLLSHNPDVISVVFLCQNKKTFLLHFNRDTKKTFIVKEKIFIDLF